MTRASQVHHGMYRCPVCGHYDRAHLGPEQPVQLITCSYCETPLEVEYRGRDSVRYSVQVAEAPASW
jgi:transcription elongation factor Elf1